MVSLYFYQGIFEIYVKPLKYLKTFDIPSVKK